MRACRSIKRTTHQQVIGPIEMQGYRAGKGAAASTAQILGELLQRPFLEDRIRGEGWARKTSTRRLRAVVEQMGQAAPELIEPGTDTGLRGHDGRYAEHTR